MEKEKNNAYSYFLFPMKKSDDIVFVYSSKWNSLLFVSLKFHQASQINSMIHSLSSMK